MREPNTGPLRQDLHRPSKHRPPQDWGWERGKGHRGSQCEQMKGRGWVAGPHGNQDGGHAAKGARGLPLKLAVGPWRNLPVNI